MTRLQALQSTHLLREGRQLIVAGREDLQMWQIADLARQRGEIVVVQV